MEDYNKKLAEDYEEILDKIECGMLPHVARIPAIDKAVSEYVLSQDRHFEKLKERGEFVPIQLRDGYLLEKMANLVFYEELVWSHPDKMSIVEFPIMSEWQEKERRNKTVFTGEITYDDRQYSGKRTTSYEDKDGSYQVSKKRIPNLENEELNSLISEIDVNRILDNADLTERQRQAIDLVFIENMSQTQASEELNVSKQAVNQFIERGLRKIKNILV